MNSTRERNANPPVRPLVGTMIGDPCGVGPEVVAKAWATGRIHEYSRPVLIGSVHCMRQAVEIAGLNMQVRGIGAPDEIADDPEILDVLDSGALDPGEVTPGRDNAACGRAAALWLDEADALARAGKLAATIMAPISTGSLKLAGRLEKVVSVTPGESYLLLVSGPLRVMHLTDHIPLRRVCDLISGDLVHRALVRLHEALDAWGLARPRIGVAGLNPHAMGDEDTRQIAPGVARAKAGGMAVEGPISPDTIFRQCVEGRYDAVLAMYHDQGHIAVKTWGFSGNSVVIMGKPYLHLSVAHGTAYDIVGKGVADHRMMLNAMRLAGSLAAGRGFPAE